MSGGSEVAVRRPLADPVPFVVSLRVPAEALALAPAGTPGLLALRVQVAEAWDAVRVEALPSTPVSEVKRAALAALGDTGEAPEAYVAKLRGREVRDEAQSLAEAGVRAGSTLLLIARRRRPVR